MGAKHMTGEQIAKIKRLRLGGMSGKEIATALSIHEGTVWNHCAGLLPHKSNRYPTPAERESAEFIQCRHCLVTKKRDDFATEKRRGGKTKVLGTCRSCVSLKYADARLKWYFGISLADYNAMLKSQNGACAICKTTTPTTGRRGVNRFNVDHDHATGKIRGLLCHKCNAILGLSEDRANVLECAADYVRLHSQTNEPADAHNSRRAV